MRALRMQKCGEHSGESCDVFYVLFCKELVQLLLYGLEIRARGVKFKKRGRGNAQRLSQGNDEFKRGLFLAPLYSAEVFDSCISLLGKLSNLQLLQLSQCA